jgi:L-lactate dehydrogenase complex protein LldF
MNKGSSNAKNWVVNQLFKTWKAHHGKLDFAGKTFNDQWKEKRGLLG